MKTKSARASLQPRVRIRVGKEIALGPGKVELLEAVHLAGSITGAARRMGMSYMRAWTLIRTMNRCFKEPLVIAERGGSQGGGSAELTPMGQQALAIYQKMSGHCLKATETDWKKFKALLR